MGGNLRTWGIMLLTAEFVYNSSVNRTIGMSQFKVVHSYQPRQSIYLIPLALHHTRMSESAASFVSYIHGLHKESVFKFRKAM